MVRDMIAKPLILAGMAMVLAGCSAGASPSAAPPTPPPTPWPAIDAAAYSAAVSTCQGAVTAVWPDGMFDQRPSMVPGYATVSLVPVDFITLDAKYLPMPASIKALWLAGLPDNDSESGFDAIARPIGGGADVLICVSFYVKDYAQYTGAGDYAVADQGMWAVDAATGRLLGNWVLPAESLPSELTVINGQESGTDVGLYYRLLGAGPQEAARDAVLLLKGALPTPTST
jgi:hypothetical protein